MRKTTLDFNKHWSFWLDWFGSSGREIRCSKQTWFTDNPNIFLSTISTQCPCFMSVQPFRATDVVLGLEKVFFDFDSTKHSNLKETFKEVRGLTKRLREHFDVEPLAVKTWRGFDVYVFLQDIKEFDLGRENIWELVYMLLQYKMLEKIQHSTLDRRCLGGIKQLARIPYSLHEIGTKCIPIDCRGRPMYIYDLGEFRQRGISQSLFRQLVGKCAEKMGKHDTLRISERLKHSADLEAKKTDILERARRTYDECKRLLLVE